MKKKHLIEDLIIQATNDVPKKRRCLRCSAFFKSESFGNRICDRCKTTTDWRNGVAITLGSSRRR
ncbi:hypothetical protein [Aliiroseovarius crassostreae]|uniref:hypothetical protein n=1 Tax=Aliiroseovarius crassostreae TaxID=154981 RepID=UPI0022002346|nr:hypothetical protein [Aliiroseovarius crassostreae]UWQ09692.1 hypothetical protein K3X25_15865 [Aliiroseovarius crassostreae]